VYQLKTDGIPVIPHETYPLLKRALIAFNVIPDSLHARFIDPTIERPFAGVAEK
jgi:hypothetical protein